MFQKMQENAKFKMFIPTLMKVQCILQLYHAYIQCTKILLVLIIFFNIVNTILDLFLLFKFDMASRVPPPHLKYPQISFKFKFKPKLYSRKSNETSIAIICTLYG